MLGKSDFQAQKIILEVIWWIITLVLSLLVLLPIHRSSDTYPFLWSNIIFVVAFITFARYIFLLQYTWLARRQYIKITLVFLSLPIIFNLVNNLNYFVTITDESSFYYLRDILSLEETDKIQTYIRTEMLFFGVGSIITAVIFPFRLLLSIWRQRNKGTV